MREESRFDIETVLLWYPNSCRVGAWPAKAVQFRWRYTKPPL